MNQPDFAALAGTTKKSQITYEKGVMPDAAYLASIAAAGANIRYIVTGDREGPPPLVLTADERVLLDSYRSQDPAMRKRILAFILGGDPSGGKVIIHGQVGNQIEKNEGEIKIDMRSKK